MKNAFRFFTIGFLLSIFICSISILNRLEPKIEIQTKTIVKNNFIEIYKEQTIQLEPDICGIKTHQDIRLFDFPVNPNIHHISNAVELIERMVNTEFKPYNLPCNFISSTYPTGHFVLIKLHIVIH